MSLNSNISNIPNHQECYESILGVATLNKKNIIAGTTTDLTLTFVAGTHGIDETGALKVLFRIASDIGLIQFEDQKRENYVYATCSNETVRLAFTNQSNGSKGKQHVRPWSQGFTVHIIGSYLKKGDIIVFHFKNTRMQTYAENNFEFKVAVDAFATGSFLFLKKSPSLTILPDKPSSLHIILPTTTSINKRFDIFLKAEDKWGNACTTLSGTVDLKPKDAHLNAPNKVTLQRGIARAKATITATGTHILYATFEKLRSASNPTLCTNTNQLPFYWADLHGQSNETVGTNTVDDYYKFAHTYAHLDITCHQGNDFQISNTFWKTINDTANKYNKDKVFVAFPGYEWSGNTSVGGDHNVIYKKDHMPLYRSSHALIDDLSDIASDASHVTDLFKKLDHKNTFTVAHVGGRYANIAEHAEHSGLDAVEMHSDWGTFEWILHDAFKKGLRVGVVANSDGHKGTPGASYPGSSHFGCQGGLTCVRAKNLTRDEVFTALKAHHTYATTGARIMLDVVCIHENERVGVSGDILTLSKQATLEITALPTTPLERIEVYKKNVLLKTFFLTKQKKDSAQKFIKVVWSGASSKGRSRKYSWDGTFSVHGTSFKKTERINFYSASDTLRSSKDLVEFTGTTTGGIQGFIVSVSNNPQGIIRAHVNGKDISLPLNEITRNPKIFSFSGLHAKLEIHETVPPATHIECAQVLVKLSSLSKESTPYYVKVIQRDGHMAWSSPIYISGK